MGNYAIKHKETIFLLLLCGGFVVCQGIFFSRYRVFSVALDFIPVLVLYCALYRSWKELFAVSLIGGFFFDSLTLNPMGVSSLSYLIPGYFIYCKRHVLLYRNIIAQLLLGFGMGVTVPFLVMIQLTGLAVPPVIDASLLWVFIVLGVTSAGMAPILFNTIEFILKHLFVQKMYRLVPSFRGKLGRK